MNYLHGEFAYWSPKILRHNGRIWFYLKGSYELIFRRMQARAHFMKPEMLRSQFDTLEEPHDAVILDIGEPKEDIINAIVTTLTP